MKKRYALISGIMAALLMVVLAPEVRTIAEVFNRLFFLLAALFAGYLIQRHNFRQRYRRRLKSAFTTRRHRVKLWWQLHGKKQLQNAN